MIDSGYGPLDDLPIHRLHAYLTVQASAAALPDCISDPVQRLDGIRISLINTCHPHSPSHRIVSLYLMHGQMIRSCSSLIRAKKYTFTVFICGIPLLILHIFVNCTAHFRACRSTRPTRHCSSPARQPVRPASCCDFASCRNPAPMRGFFASCSTASSVGFASRRNIGFMIDFFQRHTCRHQQQVSADVT